MVSVNIRLTNIILDSFTGEILVYGTPTAASGWANLRDSAFRMAIKCYLGGPNEHSSARNTETAGGG